MRGPQFTITNEVACIPMKNLPLVILFLLISIATAVAQDSATPPRDVQLDLDEAIAITMQRNLALAADAFTPEIAFDQTREPWGMFDPVATLGYNYMETAVPEVPGGLRLSFNPSF